MEQAKHLSRGQLVALSLQIDASWGVSKGKWTRQKLIDRLRSWVEGVENLGLTAALAGSVEPVELLCNLTDLSHGQLVSLCLQIDAFWGLRRVARGKWNSRQLMERLRSWSADAKLSTDSLRFR